MKRIFNHRWYEIPSSLGISVSHDTNIFALDVDIKILILYQLVIFQISENSKIKGYIEECHYSHKKNPLTIKPHALDHNKAKIWWLDGNSFLLIGRISQVIY